MIPWGLSFQAITIERQRQAFIMGCSLAAFMALSALLEASLLLNDSDEMAQQKFVRTNFHRRPTLPSKRHRAKRGQCDADALSD